MTGRALGFGAVAAAYEQFRPGYPEVLATRVLAYAGRPVHTALEIGAGTGKATRLFAGRGIAVTATDPDAAMLVELGEHVPDTVTVVRTAFEDLPTGTSGTTYDLVFAAAALHWTKPEGRWERIAALLEPGGTFASFGGQLHLADPEVDAAVVAARAALLPVDDVPPPDGPSSESSLRWPGPELAASPLFDDVRESVVERRLTLSADRYVGHLGTISAYLELSDADRSEVLRRIRAVLPDPVEVAGDVVLHLARTVRPSIGPHLGE